MIPSAPPKRCVYQHICIYVNSYRHLCIWEYIMIDGLMKSHTWGARDCRVVREKETLFLLRTFGKRYKNLLRGGGGESSHISLSINTLTFSILFFLPFRSFPSLYIVYLTWDLFFFSLSFSEAGGTDNRFDSSIDTYYTASSYAISLRCFSPRGREYFFSFFNINELSFFSSLFI